MDIHFSKLTLSKHVYACLMLSLPFLAMSGCNLPDRAAEQRANSYSETATARSFKVEITGSAIEDISRLGLQTPVSGRLFVVLTNNPDREPRFQVGVSGVPFWGIDVQNIAAGDVITITPGMEDVRGYPFRYLEEVPNGTYTMQAVLSVYTEFRRSDGHTISLHLNSGAGQNQWRAPGNAYSQPTSFDHSAGETGAILFKIDSVIEPTQPLDDGDVLQQGNPVDTDFVKFVKIKSQVLSEFWGQDIYIGANVLLPRDYDPSSSVKYPVMYMQGHFPGGRAPLGFTPEASGRGRSEGFSEFWTSESAPRMFAVSIRDANPYYDTAYSVNSANVGPYGDAIMEELIPYLESEFNMIPESWARIVAGGSTGGWEAIAMQVFYPDDFGGSWGWCPDPVDFNYYQIVNIYEDDNAYTTGNEWHKVERPNARRSDGNIRSTVRQENYLELATGSHSRSGGQWAIWEAVFGPVGEDGYPRPIWDPITGVIDAETASFWKDNYDIHQYLKRNWETVAPKLQGKLHIAVGDMDSYYLDNAVYLLDDFLSEAQGPSINASIEYGRREPHCWTGYSPNRPGENMSNIEFVQIVANYIDKLAPSGADRTWMGLNIPD